MVNLLLPTWCPGCGEAGVSVCRTCARSLGHWFRAESAAESLPPDLRVWAAGAYAGESALIVMEWKSRRRPDLDGPLHRLGTTLGLRYGQEVVQEGSFAVVPAPSGWRRRLSGKEVVEGFAGSVAEGLRRAGHEATTAPILRRRGGGQHHLSGMQRHVERADAIRVRPAVLARVARVLPPGAQVLLVDDVLTTGATLAASAAAAKVLGQVCGAIVLAATPKSVHRGSESGSMEIKSARSSEFG